MAPARTRRALLRAAGLAVAGGLAGCELRRRTPTSTETDEPATTTAGGGRTTTPSGTTYDITVANDLTDENLKPVEGADAETPVPITVLVDADRESGRTTIFERSLELKGGESKQFPAAFTTESDVLEYIVRAKMEPLVEREFKKGKPRSAAHRFSPGGFNEPTETNTFLALVMDRNATEAYSGDILVGPEGSSPPLSRS